MVKGGLGGGSGVRRVHHKRARRVKFRGRHADQVWADAAAAAAGVTAAAGEGPVGTLSRVVLDDDIPGRGKYYCMPCARYFGREEDLASHAKTKGHKRASKRLFNADGSLKPRPHDGKAAVAAQGRGHSDNGTRTDSAPMATAPVEDVEDFGAL